MRGVSGRRKGGILRMRMRGSADLIRSLHEFVESGTRDYHSVSSPMCLFRDPKEAPARIFAEFNDEAFSLNLKFFANDCVIHETLPGKGKIRKGKRAARYDKKDRGRL